MSKVGGCTRTQKALNLFCSPSPLNSFISFISKDSRSVTSEEEEEVLEDEKYEVKGL